MSLSGDLENRRNSGGGSTYQRKDAGGEWLLMRTICLGEAGDGRGSWDCGGALDYLPIGEEILVSAGVLDLTELWFKDFRAATFCIPESSEVALHNHSLESLLIEASAHLVGLLPAAWCRSVPAGAALLIFRVDREGIP